jgi:ribosomal protein L32
MKNLRKLKTGSRQWLAQLMETVIGECPELVECDHCGRVIRNGFVCCHCGSDDPGENIIRPEEFLG